MADDLFGESTSHASEQHQQRLGGTCSEGMTFNKGRGGVASAAAERCMALLLPREVSRRVFSQLDYHDLIQCSLVCKQWHLESTELRHGWKEELHWEARCVRGVHFALDSAPPGLPHPVELYLGGAD